MIVINHLLPVCAIIVLGMALKHAKVTSVSFHQTADRLIYFIFFPAMLFWKIGRTKVGAEFTPGYIYAALLSVLTIYAASTAFIILRKVPRFQAGSFSQSCYRFNTYVAVAVVLNAFGEEGAALLGILIGFAIPMINVLAVGTLIWYGKENLGWSYNLRMTLKALLVNPLIIACAAGIIVSRLEIHFPVFAANTLQLASAATLPMALLSIGAAMNFAQVKVHLPLCLAAGFFKLLLLPLVGIFFLRFFDVSPLAFKVTLLFFAMPTSTAIYVLSSQLGSDTQLASATIVASTIGSIISLSTVLILMDNLVLV